MFDARTGLFDARKGFEAIKASKRYSMKFPLKLLKSYIAKTDDQYIQQMAKVSVIVNNAYLSNQYPGKEKVDPLTLFVILTDEKGELATFPPVPPHFPAGCQPDQRVQEAFRRFVDYFDSKYPGSRDHLLSVFGSRYWLENLCRWRLNKEVGRPLLSVDSSLQLPE